MAKKDADYESLEQEGEGKAAFNMGIAKLQAIRMLEDAAHIQRSRDDLPGYYKTLQGLYIELSPRIKLDEIPKEVSSAMNYLNNNFSKIRMINKNIKAHQMIAMEFYNNLVIWEVWLRKLVDDLGMDMPSRDEPRFIIAGGGFR